ncbi:MAG: 50S ribosomal protein L15 [Candidatus Yonathbacteria bacterium CG_4_10_14_3_um_filter_47_65]|uniref:Large ribosomal subunit protein uL15 n=2 Tax=Parcubacteria group TaxID=1794811 RepID=A0A2M8D5N4_9BACT|nr:MAG: hypothetical protein AUJ44_01225 [Candidatus Nomurabacteria bacterium CG1_02_47_685]PIP03944.1 MAG: 50S ribosomal protein L15 [Candidatus Yonathbacteria bacterium CG23_combo_of_CG06-09_8_20_14_all_46_18]PIQ32359.1 MAG: 50S ribosomal protein L15 [Candidatus Yonathbacteria bacterium CG17_big_fil_post_rev_8_21_14_2_50_46_19]PIX56296.1 MAG: 50S ribosomal protein L15 [Candidatus Yonathbacteria bacterium CG_4_10_14_3_um_filter_47_65]PIY57919.1 MAG: 50S ribosomal protein L15 [Candidatus Yonath
MQLHEVKRKTPNRDKKVVGRGGKRGKTSGRGTKGQKARAGRKMRPEMRDTIKKIPKLRGYRFKSIAEKPDIVNLKKLQDAFPEGGSISPVILVERGVCNKRGRKIPSVKLLGDGAVTKKFIVSGCLVSTVAREKLEKAGGRVE